MSQRSDISQSIQTNFPDNQTNFITPTRLRSEQGLFEQYSVLNEQTASIIAEAVASASVGAGSVTTASFNAYTASTNAFTSSIQTQVSALEVATGSYRTNAQTSSMSVLSASYASSSTSASYALTASYAANAPVIDTGSFATTGSNTFNGTNTFTGSLNAESASITFLTVGTIVSSSTIFSSGSNTLGDASNDVQTLWGTVNLPTGPLQVTGSVSSTGGFTGSLQGTASYATQALSASWAPFVATNTGSLLTTASVALNTITFTKGDASTFNITVDTGSAGGGGMNLGANVFTGSQTLSSSTTPASLLLNVSGALPSFVTESKAAATGFGNIIFNTRTGAAQSGSVIVSGSANIVYYTGIGATSAQGLSGNNNIGFVPTYSGSIPTWNFNVAPSTMIISQSSPLTIAGNWIAGANGTYVAANTNGTSSFSFNVMNAAGVRISTAISGSSTGNAAAINNNNFAGQNHLITLEGSSSVVRNFTQNFVGGNANTASLTSVAGAAISSGSLSNTLIFGSGLIVSGTLSNTSISSSTFIGQFNESGSLGDPSQIRFAVGAGTANTNRKTVLYVSHSGETVIGAAGAGESGRGNSVFGVNLVKIGNNTINANTSVAQYNGSFVTNGGSIAGFTNAIVAGETNTITAGRSSATLGASANTINTNSGGGDTNNVIIGTNASIISGSTSNFTGIYSSTGSIITGSRNSAIIAGGVGTRLNNTTGSVALGRDTAYTGTANYTLYTQNVDVSGSLTVNGNKQYNFGEFWSSASVTPSAGVSASVVFDSTGASSGVAISGSGALLKITNAGTYNIQFSAQANTTAGADTLYVWFKKNGANIAASNSKVVLANNTAQLMTVNILDTAAANDYYEITYQSANGNVQLLNEAATGNLPEIPSVITTITQVA